MKPATEQAIHKLAERLILDVWQDLPSETEYGFPLAESTGELSRWLLSATYAPWLLDMRGDQLVQFAQKQAAIFFMCHWAHPDHTPDEREFMTLLLADALLRVLKATPDEFLLLLTPVQLCE